MAKMKCTLDRVLILIKLERKKVVFRILDKKFKEIEMFPCG
jgi:hypothetical protein